MDEAVPEPASLPENQSKCFRNVMAPHRQADCCLTRLPGWVASWAVKSPTLDRPNGKKLETADGGRCFDVNCHGRAFVKDGCRSPSCSNGHEGVLPSDHIGMDTERLAFAEAGWREQAGTGSGPAWQPASIP
jgi:hypothetical protein